MTNRLLQLEAAGQSVWLDYLNRQILADGELKRLIAEDGLKGVTSNPSIFEKAIVESRDYVEALEAFRAQGDPGPSQVYEHLAIADIQVAADLLLPVFDATGGRDGYVSLECSPYLANDTTGTIAEAKRLRRAVDRPNLMVKVPATRAGISAVHALAGQGLSINVTLLFALSAYQQVAEAYIGGLEEFQRGGGDVSKVAGVASFFVSRIDVAVDRRLDQLGDKSLADRLRGKAAIANAKLAYAAYQATFAGSRWTRLASAGARTQRLLWASTGTKNPGYKDTKYVEALVGRDTVDTIAPSTMDAFRDHGVVTPDAVEEDVAGARAILLALEAGGVFLEQITEELVADGVSQFTEAFDKLFSHIARRVDKG